MFTLQDEYSELAQIAEIDWDRLRGSSVLITGATGLIGGCCVRFLLERNRMSHDGIRVYALVRNAAKARMIFEGFGVGDGLNYIESDLVSCDIPYHHFDYIIHAGCPTASDYFLKCPVETVEAIVLGTRNMLNIARETRCRSFVYLSSMEVYGCGNPARGLDRKLSEEDVGNINPLSIRSCYPESKRMAELLSCTYAQEFDMQVCIARLAQTFGVGVSFSDNRIFSQFARCAIGGNDIVLRTSGASTRMYNYTTDAVTAIFTVLLKGETAHAYNVANENTYSSVLEMAHFVANRFSNGRSQVRIELDPNAPYPPEHHLPLDTTALRRLNWSPTIDLPEMFERFIAYFESCANS